MPGVMQANVMQTGTFRQPNEGILKRRKDVQILTINRRRDYNHDLRELVNAA
jgi:hypothetical protein